MYLFHYMWQLDSSKVHINCDKLWHLKFKFRSVKVQGHVSTCGKMKVSWRGKCIYPEVYKRWQFLSYSSKTFQTCRICHMSISQTTNMGSIIPHSWPLQPLKTSALCGRVNWGPLIWRNHELAVSGQFEIPMLHFFNNNSMIPCRFLAGITIKIN
jgi:hypothetical protein